MKIALSVRSLFGSLKPGESINVMLPLLAILTTEVTDLTDCDALNWMKCEFSLLYFSR